MPAFDEPGFRRKVDAALRTVRQVLENTRAPTIAADTDHRYEDKFLLAESLTNTAVAATANALERMGLDRPKLARLEEMAATRSVTLRLACKEACAFVKEETIEVESEQPLESEQALPRGWEKRTAPDGRPYYANLLTRVTQWERPA